VVWQGTVVGYINPLLTPCLLISYIVPFGIKKRLKALIRRLKAGNAPSIVRDYPTTSEVVNNTISIVTVLERVTCQILLPGILSGTVSYCLLAYY